MTITIVERIPVSVSNRSVDPKDWKSWPSELSRAICEEHRAIGENNSCDYKPTSQYEIDEATKRMVERWNAWTKLRATLKEGEENRCRRYWDATRRRNSWASAWDLVETKLLGQWVLCPRWAALLEEVRKMQEVLA